MRYESRPRILVIGAGSIGRRHAVNLLARGASVALADPVPDRAAAVLGAEPVPLDLSDLAGFDGVVVASPPVYHRAQTEAALRAGAHVLVEKPLDTTAKNVDSLIRASKGKLMVGFNLRLHEPLQRLVSWINEGRVGTPLGISLWFGSYLPDWRPGMDYRNAYSSKVGLGGGVLLDAIHELDLLVWMLDGRLQVVCATIDRLGRLEIDTEDSVKVLLRHADGAVVDISLDYLSRRYRRGVTVVGTEATARFDWARAVLELEGPDDIHRQPIDSPVSRSYEKEAEIFLQFIRGETLPPVDAKTAAVSLRLADTIRLAAFK